MKKVEITKEDNEYVINLREQRKGHPDWLWVTEERTKSLMNMVDITITFLNEKQRVVNEE